MIREYSFPTTIRVGAGVRKELGEALTQRGCARPLVVSDQSVAGLEFFKELVSSLSAFDCATFYDFSGNPHERDVVAGTQAFHHHKADALVLIGGGAALDVGKAIAVLSSQGGALFDYEDRAGAKPVTKPLPPIIAIPTTAGTGSEVGRSAVISDDQTHAKKIIFTPKMLPELVYLDPELTLSLPPKVTATTGFDALTHLIEAFLAKGYHPLCEGIALRGMELVRDYLIEAYQNPTHQKAREAMLEASMMGAIAFQKGLGATHSAAHALSTVFDLHHGTANALMLKPVLTHLKPHLPQSFASLDHHLGGDALGFITQLLDTFQLGSLKDYGVEVTRELLDFAYADGCHQLSPVAITRQDFQMLFEQAL